MMHYENVISIHLGKPDHVDLPQMRTFATFTS